MSEDMNMVKIRQKIEKYEDLLINHRQELEDEQFRHDHM